MAGPKDTAADTLRHHDAVAAREGAKLAGLAAQRDAQLRVRRGMKEDERRFIARLLREGETWEQVLLRFHNVIADETLESERAGLEALAGQKPRPVMPGQ